MQSDDKMSKLVNTIKCINVGEYQRKDIAVCVNYSDDAHEEDASALANTVSHSLKFYIETGKATAIAEDLATDNHKRIARNILRACRENIDGIGDAGRFGATVALTAAIIIEDNESRLAVAQQRNETLELMLNYDKGHADGE